MKISQSLISSTTKMSLLQPSNHPQGVHQHFIIIFTTASQQVHRIQIALHHKTIREVIKETLKKFNQELHLKLDENPEKYVVYAAKKNGKKISDYPAVDPTQNVVKTNIKYFFLARKEIQSKDENRIQTTFSMKNMKNNGQVNVQQSRSCFCLFG